MAAPTQVGTAVTTGGQGTAVAFAAPTGTTAGDHQIVVVDVATSSETVTVAPGAGWLLAGDLSYTSVPPASTDTNRLRIYVADPTADPGNATFTLTKSGARLWRGYRDVWRGGPGWDVASLTLAASVQATTHAVPAQTTTVTNSVVMGGVMIDPGAATTATVTPPAGWTEVSDSTGANSGGTVEALTVAGAVIVQATTGTVNGSFTPSITDDAIVWSIILPSDEVSSDTAAKTRAFLTLL